MKLRDSSKDNSKLQVLYPQWLYKISAIMSQPSRLLKNRMEKPVKQKAQKGPAKWIKGGATPTHPQTK